MSCFVFVLKQCQLLYFRLKPIRFIEKSRPGTQMVCSSFSPGQKKICNKAEYMYASFSIQLVYVLYLTTVFAHLNLSMRLKQPVLIPILVA